MVKVIKLKDIAKMLVLCIIVVFIFKVMNTKNDITEQGISKIATLSGESLIRYLNDALPSFFSKQNNNSQAENIKLSFSAEKILKFELEMLDNIIEKSNLEINTDNLSKDDIDELVASLDGEVQTEVIETNIKENYNLEANGVKISNKSSLELTSEIITPDFEPVNVKDIIIYHTHTCESYTPTNEEQYVATSNFRTTDLNYNMARVGDELDYYLSKYGFNVIHDKTYHDYPAYSGSYDRSYETIYNIVEKKPSIEIIFDIHRDAIGSDSEYAPTVRIGDEYAAQIMFVIGTNGGGLEHNNWYRNLKTAIKIQQKANELYPGLFKPMIVRDSRYNQNLGNSASIIEVGATGNTLEQARVSMKYLASVLYELWGNL